MVRGKLCFNAVCTMKPLMRKICWAFNQTLLEGALKIDKHHWRLGSVGTRLVCTHNIFYIVIFSTTCVCCIPVLNYDRLGLYDMCTILELLS